MKNNTIVYTMTSKGEPAIAEGEMDNPAVTDQKKMNPVLIVALIAAVYFIAR